MPRIEPSPQTTLVILLGASAWPNANLKSSPAFSRSASKLKDYFCNTYWFGLPPENLLDLFDRQQSSPYEVDQAIRHFLDARISNMMQAGTPARDLLFYYIGHGVFSSGRDQAFLLAIRCTNDDSLRASSIEMSALAETLKTKARRLRRLVVLDCCFAAEAFQYMQSAPDQVAIRQTFSAFEEKSPGPRSGFPERGTALLCSSGHKEYSVLMRDESGTMFSEALIRALSLGNRRRPDAAYLSLYELKELTVDTLETLPENAAPRPFLGSPDQSDGDVATVPIFPNSAAQRARVQPKETTIYPAPPVVQKQPAPQQPVQPAPQRPVQPIPPIQSQGQQIFVNQSQPHIQPRPAIQHRQIWWRKYLDNPRLLRKHLITLIALGLGLSTFGVCIYYLFIPVGVPDPISHVIYHSTSEKFLSIMLGLICAAICILIGVRMIRKR